MRSTQPAPIWLSAESDSPAPGPSALAWVPWALLVLLTLASAIGFAWLGLLRHAAYQSHAFDLGNMDQAVWNTLHGHPFRFTDMEVGPPKRLHAGYPVLQSRFAIHVEPLLAVFAPLYVLHGGPETLLVAQAVVVALGAIPAYLLARAALKSSWLALVFPIAYLLHPSLQNAVLDDFHAVTLSACFLLWAMYFIYRGFVPGFAVCAVLAASTKEEIGLLVAMLALALLVIRRPYAAFMSAICGAGWFFISVLLIIPAYNPSGQSPYLQRYSYLGHGFEGVLRGIIRHPRVVADVLTSTPRIAYLDFLIHPLAFVPVFGLPVLLLAAPSLAINMLSRDPTMYSGLYQYSAEVVPYVIAAGVFATAWISRWAARLNFAVGRWVKAALCLAVLVFSGVETYRFGFTPLAQGYLTPSSGSHQALEDRLLRRIPPNAVVAAADEIEPHLSDRVWVYKLPTTHPANGPAAAYLALDASIPSLPVFPYTLHEVAVRSLHRGYGIQDAQDGVLVLRRGSRITRLPPGFFAFIFQPGSHLTPEGERWGALRLVGVIVHPRSSLVNRSRPAISVETYWRASRRLRRNTHISMYLSPVYTGPHPRFSSRWQSVWDSPTLDWLPLDSWPLGRTVHAAFLPLLPDVYRQGKVDVAIGVANAGRLTGATSGQRVQGASTMVRIATIEVGS